MVTQRTIELLAAYQEMRSHFKNIASHFEKIKSLIDIGCGDGALTSILLRHVRPEKLTLVDRQDSLRIDLRRAPFPPESQFLQLDVCSPLFIKRMRRTPADLLTCISTFHEFECPSLAALNLIKIASRGRMAFIMDRSEEGWEREERSAVAAGGSEAAHYRADRERLERSGLGTNQGSESFWMDTIAPRVNGRIRFAHEGPMYTVRYYPQ